VLAFDEGILTFPLEEPPTFSSLEALKSSGVIEKVWNDIANGLRAENDLGQQDDLARTFFPDDNIPAYVENRKREMDSEDTIVDNRKRETNSEDNMVDNRKSKINSEDNMVDNRKRKMNSEDNRRRSKRIVNKKLADTKA